MRVLNSLLLVILLSACDSSKTDSLEAEVNDLQTRLAELESKIEGIETAASDLDDAALELESLAAEAESQVRRFSWEDWEYVVPRVRSAIDDIAAQASEIRSGVDEVQSAIQ